MGVGKIPAGWRLQRLLYRLQLPPSGWFVNIEASRSVATIWENIGSDLMALGLNEPLTVGHLRGENRKITTKVAEWIWHQRLSDGSLPHGIRYGSKHGNDLSCWAVWLRIVDAGGELCDEPTKADDGVEIKSPEHNRPLADVADMFGLKVF